MTEEAIFAAALEMSAPTDRSAYLANACAGSPALRQRVEALLESHFRAGAFLERSAIRCALEEDHGGVAEDPQGILFGGAADGSPLDFLAPPESPEYLGRLGHYDVLEEIGRGGM